MKLIYWQRNKFKICGIPVLKRFRKKNWGQFSFLGLPVWIYFSPVCQIMERFANNKDFNTKSFDLEIAKLVSGVQISKTNLNSHRIAFLATELYDMGGHTKCIKDLAKSFQGIYEQKLFLDYKINSFACAPKSCQTLRQIMDVAGGDYGFENFEKNAKHLAQQIANFAPKALLVYIHPDDVFGVAVLSVLKRNTDIKIIFFNHASHYPNLGMSFADVILEGMPSTQKVTEEKRGFHNCKIVGLQSLAKNETIYYPAEELQQLRQSFGVSAGELLTMSGGAGYKFFDNNYSEYFMMIKRLLSKEKNLKHVIISQFDKNQQKIIDEIFAGSVEKNRLTIIPYQTEFDKYFQCADVFIDSFPVGAALTQVDLMRNKVASVVKINKDNAYFSFHEYQMPNYPYMFENVSDMERAIVELLHDENKRKAIIAKNYDYWLKTYESSVVRDKYIKIIESAEVKLVNFLDVSYELQLQTRYWRNSSDVAKYFKIKNIEEDVHAKWLESLHREKPTTVAFMIEIDGEYIGVTYFHSINYDLGYADWGMYIYDTKHRGKGVGTKVLQNCIKYAKNVMHFNTLYLDVLNTNNPAIALYEKCGFRFVEKEKDNFLRYCLLLNDKVS